MTQLDPLQVGVVFWSGGELGMTASPREITQYVKGLGVGCGQLAFHGEADLGPASLRAWKDAIGEAGLTVVTAFMGYTGESYADLPTCQQTVGYVPKATRAEREKRSYAVSDFAKELGIPGIACHIGFVSPDRTDPEYIAIRDLMRRLCDHCAKNGQTFALETGQEPAAELRDFIIDVDRENLGINFDPANMILYGSGEPLEALDVVGDRLLTVHCKDGTWPKEKGTFGSETPLGKGDVGMDRFVAKLKSLGYSGPLVIEREITGDAQRADILEAIALLERLRKS